MYGNMTITETPICIMHVGSYQSNYTASMINAFIYVYNSIRCTANKPTQNEIMIM